MLKYKGHWNKMPHRSLCSNWRKKISQMMFTLDIYGSWVEISLFHKCCSNPDYIGIVAMQNFWKLEAYSFQLTSQEDENSFQAVGLMPFLPLYVYFCWKRNQLARTQGGFGWLGTLGRILSSRQAIINEFIFMVF